MVRNSMPNLQPISIYSKRSELKKHSVPAPAILVDNLCRCLFDTISDLISMLKFNLVQALSYKLIFI